ncbi:MAG: hypothetical protein RLZZ422_718 [Pseudomonadota bacterium]
MFGHVIFPLITSKSMLNTVVSLPSILVVAAIILNINSRQVLLAKRPDHKHQGGKWEFPGGKVEPNETPQQALVRELQEELGIRVDIKALQCFQTIVHEYPEKQVHLEFWQVFDFEGVPEGLEGQDVQWFNITALSTLTFPPANQPIVERLIQVYS